MNNYLKFNKILNCIASEIKNNTFHLLNLSKDLLT